jgi:hypothetical protein
MRITFLLTAILLFASCASAVNSNRAEPGDQLIPVRVENQIHQDVTVYITNEGRRERRLGECAALRTCQYWVPERLSNARRRVLPRRTQVHGYLARGLRALDRS